MIELLIGSITKNSETIEKLTKRVNLKFVIVGVGLCALMKYIKEQDKRIDAIEEELSELNTRGE